jgi:LysR family transcriptional regulator for metE and metH
MLEIRHLRLVQAIAQEGGPTRAAALLHLTQSAVSHQLAELEGRLGVPLFTRVRRRLHLTPAGRHLLEFAQTALSDFARVERQLVSGGSARQRLRIAVECFTSYHWLPHVLAPLRRDFPHVDVRIALDARQHPITALLRGDLELALVSTGIHDRQLAIEHLFDDEWVVALPPSHPLREAPFVRATDLQGVTVFAHEATPHDARLMRDLLVAERATMPDVQVVPLTEAIVELVGAGLGVGLVSRWAVAPHEASGTIVTRRFTKAGVRERWAAAYRREAGARLPLARFVELLRARPPLEVTPRAPAGGPRPRSRRAHGSTSLPDRRRFARAT